MTLAFTQRFYGHCIQPAIEARANALREKLMPTIRDLKQRRALVPFIAIAEREDDLPALYEWAARARAEYDRLIVFGTGGSSLGGKTVAALVADPFVPARVQFIENVSPHTLSRLLESDLGATCFLAISKSGGTMETLCQLALAHERLEKYYGPEKARAAVSVLTGPGPSALRTFAEAYRLEIFEHDPDLGGRFSVLSNVGLLPAAFAGLNLAALRQGARRSLDDLWSGDQIAAQGASMAAVLAENFPITVAMTYSDRLKSFGDWFRQLWAESLGKDGKGTTPMQALGTVDQHSQLQLYLGGPRDKYFTLITGAEKGGPVLPKIDGLPYLQGKRVGQVLGAHARATVETLAAHACPVRLLEVETVGEGALGALFMHYMLETVLTAALIGVNPYDQPAVEESKQRARKYLEGN